jgi:hypothetical protein
VEKNDARPVLQTLVGRPRYCNFCNTSGVDSELICSFLANVISAICNLPVATYDPLFVLYMYVRFDVPVSRIPVYR